MFNVSSAKGMPRLHRCGCDQSVSQLNAVGEGVLFDEGGGCSTDGFGKGQDSELELAERLLDLPGFQLRSGALKKLNEGNDGQGAIWFGIDGAGRAFAAAGRPRTSVSKIISTFAHAVAS